jgi:hypothetical protein
LEHLFASIVSQSEREESAMTKSYVTEEELEKLAREAMTWVSSPAGQQTIQETRDRSREVRDKLDEAHRIDPRNPFVTFTL